MIARPSFLDTLNDAQREAVAHAGGPLLVLAGAGSGKTRVITHRIAWLVLEAGVPPHRIIAVTFTNKAAAEMRERVERLLSADRMGAWIGTFHSLCLRLLRRHGDRVGLAPGFNVYDATDQLAVVKKILKEEVGDDAEATPRALLSRISRAKNAMDSPDEIDARAFTPDRKLLAVVYRRYVEALAGANAADFDDLLLKAIALFREHADVRETYARRCEHLLVDEYQDTNRPQYHLVRALSSVHGNVCVVGDEDQSIYRFRGAELRNILEFEEDHPGTRTIRLEQNYRSTGTILDAAGAVIRNNVARKGKELWTRNPRGERLALYRAPDDRSEAVWVAERVRELVRAGRRHEELAVLYRTNAQSRLFEEIFRRDGIPHQVVGAVQFYERKEVKDLLGYLKLVANPRDDVALRRVINTPARGIGETTVGEIERVAETQGIPLVDAAREALARGAVAARSAARLAAFLELLDELVERAREGDSVPALLERIIERTAWEAHLDKAYGLLAAERMENVRALVSAAVEHAEEEEDADLRSFLDRSALVSDADEVGREPGVTLMTIHCAKGLEFPVVFLAGLEERLFPHAMASEKPEDVEEERRLCYVAMTRARERLLLSHARFRRVQGASLPSVPSRFLGELPEALLEETGPPEEAGFFDPVVPRGRRGGREWWSAAGSGSSAARAATTPPPPAAARMVQPARAGAPPADGYAVGSFVRHPRFGAGRILDREGGGKNLKLTIQFLDHGPKKILPAYTKLQVELRR